MGNTFNHCWQGLTDCTSYCCEGCEACYVCLRPCCFQFKDCLKSCCGSFTCIGCASCLECNLNPCLILDKSTPEISEILSNYNPKSHYRDEWFGDVILLENKQTKLLYVLKVQEHFYQSEYFELNGQFTQRKLLQNDNIICLKEYLTRQEEGFCTSIYKSFLIFDYILTDLATEFQYRLDNKIQYSQDEYYPLMYHLINGLNYLHSKNIPHKSIRMRNIYITQEQYKLSDPHLFDFKSDYDKINNNSTKYSQVICLSPELLSSLDKGNNNPDVDWYKCDIFSLGMVFLQLCSGKYSWQCYNYEQGVIYEDKITSHLQKIKIECHDFFYFLIKDMLQVKISQRPSAQLLLQRLELNPKCKNSIALSPIQLENNNQYQQQQQLDIPIQENQLPLDNLLEPNTFDQYDVLGLIGNEPQKQKDIIENVKEKYPNGSRYQGSKRNGLRHGKGKFINNDSSYYDGQWKDNKMNGKGTLYNSEGKIIYDGQWLNDQYHGQGIEYNQESIPMISGLEHNNLSMLTCWIKYEGAFKYDQKDGFGTMFLSNGDKYVGAFKTGQIHGYGTYSYKNGQQIQGKWNMGMFQK